MGNPLGRAHHVSARNRRQRGFRSTKYDVTTHASGQVQNNIHFGVTNAVCHFTVQCNITRWRAGFGVAHVAMDHRGTGAGGIYRTLGYLLGRTRNMWAAILGRSRPGYGTGDKNLAVHLKWHLQSPFGVVWTFADIPAPHKAEY